MDNRALVRSSAGLLLKAALALVALAADAYRASLFGSHEDVSTALADLRWVDTELLR